MRSTRQFNIIRILSAAGLLIACLSALEPHLSWLSALCGLLGDGCRDAEAYTLFNIPVAPLGIAFYLWLTLLGFLRAKRLFFWSLMSGFGFEILLVKVMLTQHFFCLFCFLNLIVILGLLVIVIVIRPGLAWQAAAISLICAVSFETFLGQAAGNLPVPVETDPKVAGIVAGEPIFHLDLEAPIAGRLYRLKKDIYALKRQQLDERVRERLIALEAVEQGLSPEQLTQKIYSEAVPVTPADVEAYYRENQAVLSRNRDGIGALKIRIAAYLASQNRTDAMQAFLKPLLVKYHVQDLYQPPALPAANVDISASHSLGPEDAGVTIVEFSDYLCPSCRNAHTITRKIKEKYKGRIRWIFKDYPLKRHQGAIYLAMAARCAGEQGKFWEFQDLLFESEDKSIGREQLMAFASTLALDLERFAQSLDSNKYLPAVENDILDLKKVGGNSTPTFIINGKLHPGCPSFEKFSEMIDAALGQQGGMP